LEAARFNQKRDSWLNRCSVEKGFDGFNGCFEVFREPPVPVDPGEEALDHPSAGDNSEADLIAKSLLNLALAHFWCRQR